MAIGLSAVSSEPLVSYRAGYRNGYHVKSMVIDKGHPIHEVFGGGDRKNRVVQGNAASVCFARHEPHKGHDHVFNRLRE